MHDAIYEKLKQVARSGEITYYADIAPLAGLDMSNPDDRNKIRKILGEISTYEHQKGHPLLSAVVIHRDDNMPGDGFFTLARALGIQKKETDFIFFIEELRRVHDWWKAAP